MYAAMELSSTLPSDASQGSGVVDPSLRPLCKGWRIAGPASTVRVSIDDNLDVRQAVLKGPFGGTVLVITGGIRSRAACMGSRLAREARDAGFTAVVTDAPVRDSPEIVALGFPTWCRGVTPVGPTKRGGGEIGIEVYLGGVKVPPGDCVIADDDGIVIWPEERLGELTRRAEELARRGQETQTVSS